MSENTEFEFAISVSTGSYPTKKPEKAWEIQYSPQTITIPDLERLQREGKSFCYNFKDVSDSGLITVHQKTLKGFDYTNVLFYDIDKMPVSMNDYIKPLPFKPTLAYTTISNGIDKHEGKYGVFGYRLIYAFQEPVTSIDEFDELYYAIASANGFRQQQYDDGTKYEFDYRKVNQQYYGGGLNSETYRSDIVYCQADFSAYIEQGIKLRQTISGGSKTKNKKSTKEKENFPRQIIIRQAQEGQAYYSEMENPFFNDLFTLSPSDFLLTYDKAYLDVYHRSLSSPLTLSTDGKYWIYPEDYQEVKRHWCRDENGKRHVGKWAIGSGRKKRMYVTAQIMRYNVTNITREELIYCLIRERFYYDNSDNNLNNKFIIQVADSALSNEFKLSPCKHPKISVNKDYAQAMGMTANAAKNHIRKEMKEEQVMAYYDFGLSVKENLKVMKANGIKVGKSYLYNMRQKYADKF